MHPLWTGNSPIVDRKCTHGTLHCIQPNKVVGCEEHCKMLLDVRNIYDVVTTAAQYLTSDCNDSKEKDIIL